MTRSNLAGLQLGRKILQIRADGDKPSPRPFSPPRRTAGQWPLLDVHPKGQFRASSGRRNHSMGMMPHPVPKSQARSFRRGAAKSDNRKASVPNCGRGDAEGPVA